MRDDTFIIEMIRKLHERTDVSDDSSFDNTILQFFESPRDKATITVQVSAVNTTPGSFMWGDATHSAGWYWNYGGKWS